MMYYACLNGTLKLGTEGMRFVFCVWSWDQDLMKFVFGLDYRPKSGKMWIFQRKYVGCWELDDEAFWHSTIRLK